MKQFTILVVDDDPAIRHVLNELLTEMPAYRVLLAGDSGEAVRVFEEESQIDVVLTDIHMPGRTGFEMVSEIKSANHQPEVLVMTANGTPENVEKARKIGARSMILKPFDNLEVVEAEVRRAIEAVVEKSLEDSQSDELDSTSDSPVAAATEATVEVTPVPEAPDPASTAEQTDQAIPEEMESIFRVAADLDAEGLKLQVPIVCLQTWEEQDAVDVLRRMAGELGRKLNTWSPSRGMLDESGEVSEQACDDPNQALDYVTRQGRDRMVLLSDFGRYLEDPQVVQTLGKMVTEGHSARVMVVLTAPRMSIPSELEDSCVRFEWPASSREVTAVFDEVHAAVESSAGRPIPLGAEACETIFERVRGLPDGRLRFEIARSLVMLARG